MGPLGTQELVVIFILALLLFGPHKLPELGRTVAKALNEFRRAKSQLTDTFNREMQNLERESGIRELTATSYQSDSYNYDYSSYDSSSYYANPHDSTETNELTAGASATLGAAPQAPLQIEAAAGSIAAGHLESAHAAEPAVAVAHSDSVHAAPAEATHSEKPVTT